MDDSPRTLTTVETTCDVITALKDLERAGVTELAEHLDLSPGAVYNHLATLRDQQLVAKDDGKYRLSLRFFNLGQFVKHRTLVYNVAKPELDELAKETGSYSNLMIEEHGLGIYLYKTRGKMGITEEYQALKTEVADHLHYSSTGKAILAHLPPQRVEAIIDQHGLPAQTEHTITDAGRLFDELEAIRDRGYARNDEEEIPGARAVGAPILGPDGDVLGAIAVSATVGELDDEAFRTTIPNKVMKAANVIEVRLETSKQPPIRY